MIETSSFIRSASPEQAEPSATEVLRRLADVARRLTDVELDKLVNEIGVGRVFDSIDRLTGPNSAA
jgi:hypothetical protein